MGTLSIKAKMALSYVGMLLMLLGIGLFGLSKVALLHGHFEEMARELLPVVANAGAMNTMSARLRIAESRLLVTHDEAERGRVVDIMNQRRSDLEKLIEKHKGFAADDDDRQRDAELVKQFAAYSKFMDEIVGLITAGRQAEGEQLFNSSSLKTYQALNKMFDAAVAHELETVNADAEDAGAVYGAATAWIWGSIGAGVLVTVLLAWLMARNVAAPLTAMTTAMGRLAEDDLSVAIPGVGRGDEIGAMAAAVAVFKDKMGLNRQLQAEAKQAELRAAEQRKQDMNRLADSFEQSVSGVV
ncbi:MAG TPA: MCP four helix bundle domain-containing protein, partial [Candidatus Omnitrophota bacterium]|nr:MCP four helix bundle domain-containing protein [Candidatus Omnitrophota bacterium]